MSEVNVDKVTEEVDEMAGFDGDNDFIETLNPDGGSDIIASIANSIEDNMPTDEEIQGWKIKYGKVFMVDLLDKLYIYRGISRPEVKVITAKATSELLEMQKSYRGLGQTMSQQEQIDLMEDIMRDTQVRTCVLYPDLNNVDFNDPTSTESLAGVIPALADYIDEISGFGAKSQPREL